MTDFKDTNSKVSNIVYAAVIALVAISIPVYFLWGETWDEFELTPLAVIIPFLYAVIVIGFILMALNIKIKSITSQEADEKILNKYRDIRKRIFPYILLVLFSFIIWNAFTLWQQLK